MVKFKMLAKDINSSPTQYRTWIVEDNPDFDAIFYTGLKSGDNSFVDVSAFIIYDDATVADFNFPIVQSFPSISEWINTKKVLPSNLTGSQLAIADGYAYLFGGKGSNKILRAALDNPADWQDTGAILPAALHNSQLAIVDDYIYLFGGAINNIAVGNIYSAPKNNPLNWTDHGNLLPRGLKCSQLVIANNTIYLVGGHDYGSPVSNIFSASASNPLSWYDTGNKLPSALYNSHISIIEDKIYLFGGQTSNYSPTNEIFRANLSSPTLWQLCGSLPSSMCSGQFFAVANEGYLVAPASISGQQSFKTRIFRCKLSNPTQWVDTQATLPGDVSEFQLAIIYDRVFLFGSNGNSTIFANKYLVKYNFTDPVIVNYGNITRTQYNNTLSPLDLFKVIGFPNWKTDYGTLL